MRGSKEVAVCKDTCRPCTKRGGTLQHSCEIGWELYQAFPLQAFHFLGRPTPVTFSQHDACGVVGFLIGSKRENGTLMVSHL